MPDRAARQFVGFHHGVGRRLDAALHAQRAQQVAHQRGLAGAEVALQGDEGIGRARVRGQTLREGPRVVLAVPAELETGRSYNRGVAVNGAQGDFPFLLSEIRGWARELGFSQIGVAGVDLSAAEPGLLAWLANGFHGEMAYMESHGVRRARPAELVPGTASVITARMDYLPATTIDDWQAIEFDRLQRPGEAIVSLYARGRDYHKVLRARLQKLSERIAAAIGPFGHRVFTDSAPVLEVELAARSGQGWRGRHTLVLNREGGSMFFLGEIYVDLALPPTEAVSDHCGTCHACLDVCPTGAIVAPYRLDARRCISYLTIEHRSEIDPELHPLLGDLLYGCDICQDVCPWNIRFATELGDPALAPRPGNVAPNVEEFVELSDDEFQARFRGSPMKRAKRQGLARNAAILLANRKRGQ